MNNEILASVKARKNFYRDNYRRASSILIGVLCFMFVLILLNIYFYMQRSLPQFYATSNDGKLVPLMPMNIPNYSSTPLIQ